MLSIKRPTPTTVLYTVSTRTPTRTITARIQRYGTGTIRIILGLFVLLVIWIKAQETDKVHPSYFYPFHGKFPADLATYFAAKAEWPMILATSAAAAWLIVRKGYTEESLLVIRGLGVQTSTSSPTYLSAASTRFIPTNMIQDIFIHEAFKGFEVRFYLSIVVEDEQEVVVVFPSILPKRQSLEEVWRGARACLYEPTT